MYPTLSNIEHALLFLATPNILQHGVSSRRILRLIYKEHRLIVLRFLLNINFYVTCIYRHPTSNMNPMPSDIPVLPRLASNTRHASNVLQHVLHAELCLARNWFLRASNVEVINEIAREYYVPILCVGSQHLSLLLKMEWLDYK